MASTHLWIMLTSLVARINTLILTQSPILPTYRDNILDLYFDY